MSDLLSTTLKAQVDVALSLIQPHVTSPIGVGDELAQTPNEEPSVHLYFTNQLHTVVTLSQPSQFSLTRDAAIDLPTASEPVTLALKLYDDQRPTTPINVTHSLKQRTQGRLGQLHPNELGEHLLYINRLACNAFGAQPTLLSRCTQQIRQLLCL